MLLVILLTATWLAQFVKNWSAEGEFIDSNTGWTNTHDVVDDHDHGVDDDDDEEVNASTS